MEHRLRVLLFSFTLLLFLLIGSGTSFGAQVYENPCFQVRISLFEIPSMIVSRTFAGQVNTDGSVVGTTVGGSTTASFPNSVVILENRLSGTPLDMTIKRSIREYMANDCIRSQDITVFDLANHDFLWDDDWPNAKEVNQDVETDRLKLAYRLRVEPAWKSEEGIGIALQLWMSWENLFEVRELGAQKPERQVLDERVSMKPGQTTLIGFRSAGKLPRGSICWLAISLDQK